MESNGWAGEILNAGQFLNAVPSMEYWISSMPSRTDGQISQLIGLYTQLPAAQRCALVSTLSRPACFALSTFAVRAAMLSIRQESTDTLHRALVAETMILDRDLLDARDVLMDLSVIYYSAVKLGSHKQLFEEAAQNALKGETGKWLMTCLRWPRSVEAIRAMGWREVEGPSGLVYVYGDQPIPEGHL